MQIAEVRKPVDMWVSLLCRSIQCYSLGQMSETLPAVVKRIDPVGKTIYGDSFTGFNKIGEITDLIGPFKEYYYEQRIKNPNVTKSQILREFNSNHCVPLGKKFHPSMSQMRTWHRKWDKDLMQQRAGKELDIPDLQAREIRQIVATRRDGELVIGLPTDSELEAGLRTLGGEIMNDALQMLRDDQELEEIYDDDTLIKRRNYVVNVFGHVTKLVHGKAALMLKASEEKRNNAGFLMSLLARAQAGKVTDDEMEVLKTAYAPQAAEANVEPAHV